MYMLNYPRLAFTLSFESLAEIPLIELHASVGAIALPLRLFVAFDLLVSFALLSLWSLSPFLVVILHRVPNVAG